jgi:hypothetical protein
LGEEKVRSRTESPWLLLLFIVLVTIPFGIMAYLMRNSSDYVNHLFFTKTIALEGYSLDLAHTLFSKLVIFIRALIPMGLLLKISESFGKKVIENSFELSTLIVICLAYALTALIVWKVACTRFKEEGIHRSNLLALVCAAIVLVVGPISTFTFPQQQYLGYFSPNPYHNPTFIILKPLALMWFFMVVDQAFKKPGRKSILIVAAIAVFTTTAKPSFTITFLPALLITFLLFYVKKVRLINWKGLLIGTVATAVLILGVQYIQTYSREGSGTLSLDPLKVILIYSPNLFIALLKVLMSVLFPLSVTLFNWKLVSDRIDFRLGWINYLVGVILVFLLSEGNRDFHANLFWGPMIGAFLLFVITTIYFFSWIASRGLRSLWSPGNLIPLILLAAHIIYGVIYYINLLGPQDMIP